MKKRAEAHEICCKSIMKAEDPCVADESAYSARLETRDEAFTLVIDSLVETRVRMRSVMPI